MPQDVKLSPDGRVFYVADMKDDGVYLIDGDSLKIISFLPTGKGAHGLYCSRDSKVLYVSNRGEGTVSVIDFANGLVARRAGLLIALALAALAIFALLSGLVLFPLSWLLKRKGKPLAEGELPPIDPAAAMSAPASAPDFAAAFSKPPEVDASSALANFAPWLAILTGLLPLVFVGLAIYFIGPLVTQNRAVLLLGLPGSLTWLFFLPLVNTLLALLVPAATVMGLLSGKWSGRRIAYFALLSLAAVTLIVALGLLGLLTALLGQGLALVGGLLGNG
jgi:hypothetical protein